MAAEYLLMVAVYFGVYYVTQGNVAAALIAMLATMIGARLLRPKVKVPPPPTDHPSDPSAR